ncbi:MAG: ABC transporter permease [Eubacteriales bacterium]|nr:ABC transporter permease [Eubacteriales bacterium]
MKKTLFRGFKPVFAFTARQNIKSKGFLATTIIVGLIMFAIPFGANVYMGYEAKKDASESVEEFEGGVADTEGYINSIYFVNNTKLPDEQIKTALDSYCIENKTSIAVVFGHDENESHILKNAAEVLKTSQVIYSITLEDDKYKIKAYVEDGNEDAEARAQDISEYMSAGLPGISYAMAGLDMDTIANIAAGGHNTVTRAGQQAEGIGVILVKTLLPMLVGLLLYMIINMSAQSVTKVVIAEKTSKLMETLLTSAMPYGIVAGKILAVTLIAIAQMLLWLLSLVIGFAAGHLAAKSICPDYENMIIMVIDMIRESCAGAFGITSVILGVFMLMLGFLFYCVYAGFIGTFVQKVEDLSVTQLFLVFPLMVCWLAAYMAPVLENDILFGFVRLFPMTSPFSIPADVIVGNVGIFMAAGSIVILLVFTAVMILLTGYMYKKRVFR